MAIVMGLFPRPTHMPICNKIKLRSILSGAGMPNKYLMKCLRINISRSGWDDNTIIVYYGMHVWAGSGSGGWERADSDRVIQERVAVSLPLWRSSFKSKEVLSIASSPATSQGHEIGNHHHQWVAGHHHHHQLMAFHSFVRSGVHSLERGPLHPPSSRPITIWSQEDYTATVEWMGGCNCKGNCNTSAASCRLGLSESVSVTMHIWWVLFTRVLWNVSSALLMMQTEMNFCCLLLRRRRRLYTPTTYSYCMHIHTGLESTTPWPIHIPASFSFAVPVVVECGGKID